MTRTSIHTHVCVFFDDGAQEPICCCGVRAVQVLDDHGLELLVTPLLDDEDLTPAERSRELAFSA